MVSWNKYLSAIIIMREMKQYLLFAYSILLFTSIRAQEIRGRVTDSASVPVANATIEIGRNIFTITNELGEFGVRNLKEEYYTLKISAIGFVALRTEVKSGAVDLHFKMKPIHIAMIVGLLLILSAIYAKYW